MQATNGTKTKSNTLKSVCHTLKEITGTQPDDMENSKLNLLIGLDSAVQCHTEHLRANELNIENISTTDYNLCGKDLNKTKATKCDHIEMTPPFSEEELRRRKQSDPSETNGHVNGKSAFNRVNENKFPYGVNAMEYLYSQYHMAEEFNIMNLNSLANFQGMANGYAKNQGFCKDSNGNFVNNMAALHNFNMDHNFSQPANTNANKPLLFTSVKNSRKERKANPVNFHIIKNEHSGNSCVKSDFSKFLSNHESSLKQAILSAGNVKAHCNDTDLLFGETKSKTLHEGYLELLIIAAESLVEKGLTSSEELNSVTLEENSKLHFSDKSSFFNNELKKLQSQSNDEDSSDTSSSLVRKCENKVCNVSAAKSNSNWVKIKSAKNKSQWLCTACHKAWKNNQFCFYCNIIYRDNSVSNNYYDPKTWIQCDYCEMWHHIQCEESKGCYSDLSGLIEDSLFKYMCPLCRKKPAENTNSNMTLMSNNSSNNARQNSEVKQKRKYHYRRNNAGRKEPVNYYTANANGNGNDFLGHKLKNEVGDIPNLNLRTNKRKSLEIEPMKHSVANPFSNSILNSNDSRDIYHDFYKIANITQEDKKK